MENKQKFFTSKRISKVYGEDEQESQPTRPIKDLRTSEDNFVKQLYVCNLIKGKRWMGRIYQ